MRSSEQNAIPFVPALLDRGSDDFEPTLPPLDWLHGAAVHDAPHTGIKALMLAVLEEAIRNYLGLEKRVRDDAALWIASRGHDSPFSFRTVCETLGLEPSAVRRALYQLREKNVSAREAGRIRPNVYRKGRLTTHHEPSLR